ncbi:AzlD domain-containing protein [Ensifer sp. SSB1]|uniref:AzlD family protein n=1 Tax=Ensifer sp. SSB1 TaxID=2795385 RepID=UPI001A3E7556|nr:AzlD domain-containing protein [Ensifer sp. SSB1]MBK5571311.1 AzlD domain-containing protein [Ensifer sp. SSB1]
MIVDLNTLLAIVAMAAATIATRIGGLVLIRYVMIGEGQKRALEAIPPAVLMAVIAPTALVTGPAETIAAAATAVAATRLPLLASVAVGVISVALLRQVLGGAW